MAADDRHPPEGDAECRCKRVRRNRHAELQQFGYFIQKASEILARAHRADRSGQDVIKNERGN